MTTYELFTSTTFWNPSFFQDKMNAISTISNVKHVVFSHDLSSLDTTDSSPNR